MLPQIINTSQVAVLKITAVRGRSTSFITMATGGDSDVVHINEETELIKVTDKKHKYINTKYEKVSAKMYDYKCDIKLQVANQVFRAHKAVLSEASDYFSAMFGHDMREKDQNTIELQAVSACGITAMLEYFYHGWVHVQPDIIEDVLECARFFHIEWLVDICSDFLIRHSSLESFEYVIELADKYYLGDLRLNIFRFLCHNFMQLTEQPKFLQLSYELFYQILADDLFIAAPENFIIATVLRWVRHDPQQREEHKIPLLQLIRYPLLPPEELERIPPDLLANPDLKELIDEAKDFQEQPGRQCLLVSPQTEVRGSQEVLGLFSAYDDANLLQYKVSGMPGFFSEPISTAFLQSIFEFARVTVLGNFVFVAGGYDRKTFCSSPAFYRYNPRDHSWAELSAMKQGRVSFDLCAGKTGLYAVAGIDHTVTEGNDQEHILNTVEFYDPVKNLWDFITNLPYGCFSSAATAHKDRLYVSGGISDDTEDTVPLAYLHTYSPDTEEWLALSPMQTERQSHAMACHHDRLYVFGGYTCASVDLMTFEHLLKCEMYDVETDQWTFIQDVPLEYGHIHQASAMLDDKIYIIGGASSQRYLLTYDAETGELEDTEYCGEQVVALVKVQVALPFDIELLSAFGSSEEEVK